MWILGAKAQHSAWNSLFWGCLALVVCSCDKISEESWVLKPAPRTVYAPNTKNHEEKRRNTLPPKLSVLIAWEINLKGSKKPEEAVVTKRMRAE